MTWTTQSKASTTWGAIDKTQFEPTDGFGNDAWGDSQWGSPEWIKIPKEGI